MVIIVNIYKLLKPCNYSAGTIGVGAGKFLGLRRILPEFSQICPKNFWATVWANIFS